MYNNGLKKTLFNSSGVKYCVVFGCNASSFKSPSSIESKQTSENPVLPYLRTLVERQRATPFSEVKQDTFFTALVKSFDSGKQGPADRFTWNKNTFTITNFMKYVKRKKREYEMFQQRYIPQRHEQLGNEIAAAHFIVFRGGAVKFYGGSTWVRRAKGGDVEDYDKELPKTFVPNLYLEAIDASNMELYYESLENLHKLANLKWLSLQNCKLVDDWYLDKICGEFSNSLQHLDISGCHNVSYRGLTALCKLKNLSCLVANNISDSYEFQLSCIMLQDIYPDLKIVGVNFLQASEDNASSNDVNNKKENNYNGKIVEKEMSV